MQSRRRQKCRLLGDRFASHPLLAANFCPAVDLVERESILAPYPISVPHRCSPRAIEIARKQQVTGGEEKIESAFCGPGIATGAFHGTAPFSPAFSPS